MNGHANEPDSIRRPVPYPRALRAQGRLVERRRAGRCPDTLWLLEHPPTITWGTSGGPAHLLRERSELAGLGYELCSTRRGGDITCHEPGQLVGYPIVQLGAGGKPRDLHRYLRALEEGVIRLLGELSLQGSRVEGRTGVWITRGGPARKIAAVGVRCAGWVTSHGFALNVENSLEGFRHIVPCGISDAGVTSLERELGADRGPAWSFLLERVHARMEEALEGRLRLLVAGAGVEAAPAAVESRGPGCRRGGAR